MVTCPNLFNHITTMMGFFLAGSTKCMKHLSVAVWYTLTYGLAGHTGPLVDSQHSSYDEGSTYSTLSSTQKA